MSPRGKTQDGRIIQPFLALNDQSMPLSWTETVRRRSTSWRRPRCGWRSGPRRGCARRSRRGRTSPRGRTCRRARRSPWCPTTDPNSRRRVKATWHLKCRGRNLSSSWRRLIRENFMDLNYFKSSYQFVLILIEVLERVSWWRFIIWSLLLKG